MRPYEHCPVQETRAVDSDILLLRVWRTGRAHVKWTVLVVAMALAISTAGLAVAQEDDGTARELLHETSGSFDIRLRVEPAEVVAGVVHLVVAVLAAGDSKPVEGAVVDIVATDSEGSAVQSRAVSAPRSPGVYQANLVLEPGGLWAISVVVDEEELGSANLEVSLTVAELELSAGWVGTILWMVTTAALVAGGLYLWRRSRTAMSRRW